MQSIVHRRIYPEIHPIFSDIEKLYTYTSEKNHEKDLLDFVCDTSFEELLNLFIQYANCKYKVQYKNKQYEPLELPEYNDKNIIVCFSGGKDSLACVLHYLNEGYNVYLYHLRHINFSLTDEWEIASRLADDLNLPIFIDDIKLSGHHDYIEHPMKNIIIASGALQYGIRNNIGTKVAFGNYITSTVDQDNFEYCGGDDVETWNAYEHIIRQVIPDFHVDLVLSNIQETLESICQNRELLNGTVSCLGRTNFRQHWHDWVKNKFGIELPPYRCGRCYKCCMEYIYMTDHNLQDYSSDYYRYCLDTLRKNVQREDDTVYSEDDVWNHYFFYDKGRSKFQDGLFKKYVI